MLGVGYVPAARVFSFDFPRGVTQDDTENSVSHLQYSAAGLFP